MTTPVFKMDLARAERIGFAEAILCDSKVVAHIDSILDSLTAPVLLTRLDTEQYGQLDRKHQARIDFDPVSRTGWFLKEASTPAGPARVAIIAAGTSDVPVAREAARTLEFSDVAVDEIVDVGVAGIWRLLERIDEISRYEVVIAVAGMDAALPTVLGGLVPAMIIAVPTSVGYGVATGGSTALNAILASCAPGVTVVNIDNGYGAACAALRAINQLARSGSETK